jgi:hypothetical protein
MLIIANPELLEKFMPPQEVERYREKWQEPKKPTVGQMMSKISEDKNKLAEYVRRVEQDLYRIDGEVVGVFDDFDEDIDQKFPSRHLADQDSLIAAKVGPLPITFDAPRRHPVDDDEAQAKEDFLYRLHEEHRRQHERSGHTDLDIDMTKTLTRYGRLCTRNVCNFSGRPGAAPFKMKLIDPAVVFPTFNGDNGLVKVTLSYKYRVGDFLGDHDDEKETMRAKLARTSDDNGRKDQSYTDDDEVNVEEYWDCKWYAVFVAGRLVKGPVAHDYGEPPFVYTFSSWGPPSYTRTPESASRLDRYGYTMSSGSMDFARKGRSYYDTQFDTHSLREAVLGKAVTKFKMWGNEPLFVAQDDMVYGSRPDVSRAEGAVNMLRSEHEQLVPPPDPPMPPTFPVIMQAIAEDTSRGGLPPQEYGLTPSAQQSGYSIAGLGERGQNKMRPVILAKQSHHALCGEQRLRFYMENGHIMGEEGKKGTYSVPRVDPYQMGLELPEWSVTPQMIERTGWAVNCTLIETPGATEMGAQANAFKLYQSMGAITREDIIRESGLPGARNPIETKKRVDNEAIEEMPEYKLARMLEYVMLEEKNPAKADFIAAQIAKGKAKEAAQMMGSMGGPGGPPVGGGQGPAMTPGQSLPGMGQPPGSQGGRPPQGGGLPGPPGGTSGPPVEP